jgi:hypothetical protein
VGAVVMAEPIAVVVMYPGYVPISPTGKTCAYVSAADSVRRVRGPLRPKESQEKVEVERAYQKVGGKEDSRSRGGSRIDSNNSGGFLG